MRSIDRCMRQESGRLMDDVGFEPQKFGINLMIGMTVMQREPSITVPNRTTTSVQKQTYNVIPHWIGKKGRESSLIAARVHAEV